MVNKHSELIVKMCVDGLFVERWCSGYVDWSRVCGSVRERQQDIRRPSCWVRNGNRSQHNLEGSLQGTYVPFWLFVTVSMDNQF